jgi:serine/threonine protein kinase
VPLCTLGCGGFGYVSLSRTTENNFVAIKSISKSIPSSIIFNEYEIMKSLPEDVCVTPLEVFQTQKRVHIVMEYMEGGTLKAYCENHSVTMETIKNIIVQMVYCLQKVHDCGVIHRYQRII